MAEEQPSLTPEAMQTEAEAPAVAAVEATEEEEEAASPKEEDRGQDASTEDRTEAVQGPQLPGQKPERPEDKPTTETAADDDDDEEAETSAEEKEAEEAWSSMDEADFKRHCASHTITQNRGSAHRPHHVRSCRHVDNFRKLNLISEGSYGRVWRASQVRNARTRINALKQVKMEKEKEGFPITALREIDVLMRCRHPNIVAVEEIVVGNRDDSIFLVMEYVEHDIKYLMEQMKARFSQAEVKCLLMQLLRGCAYMHSNWIIHRDLKTSNLLYTNTGVLKICDFGLARFYGEPIKKMTPGVVTLWYRSPEILLGEESYTPAVDMWSVGCIFAELLNKEPMCSGSTESAQLLKLWDLLGTPTEEQWPGWERLPNAQKWKFEPQRSKLRQRFPAVSSQADRASLTENGFDLLSSFLAFDPKRRTTAEEALSHSYFNEIPAAQDPGLMPSFAATNEQPRKKRKRAPDAP
eukprot:TRINITY_DN5276_c0_g1_i1.p1 TRINITY_DN5276_c0_g1~~TRINITY_DN5276_c0_g1_i1.p1  ORF type:complete len:473 (+),score=111.56 TRINITY_DN5276_c0_g1_i1:23-1420(+)